MTIARGTTAIIINNKTINISQVSIFRPKFPLHLLLWLPNKLLLIFNTIPKQKSLTLYFIQHMWANYLRHEKNLVMS